MALIIRKGRLPRPEEVDEPLREAAAAAQRMTLREPRPAGFPLLFTSDLQIIEPALAFLHEHGVQRAHTDDTIKTYAEILYDWFDTLEQSGIVWAEADPADLIAYRNRMLTSPSAHTGRPYSVRTINHRVRGVLRFYAWAVRQKWLRTSPLSEKTNDFTLARGRHWERVANGDETSRRLFILRQFESLPRPLAAEQARELLARLTPPYDLMARWQLYTGLRVSELLRLTVSATSTRGPATDAGQEPSYRAIDVMRKGRKPGYVIASESLLEETDGFRYLQRAAWLKRGAHKRRSVDPDALFINDRGCAVKKNTYQRVMSRAGVACGFKATTHLMRATFACMMLARLEQLASEGAAINPLLIVKILMAHTHIETTDRYLRAIAMDTYVLADALNGLISDMQ